MPSLTTPGRPSVASTPSPSGSETEKGRTGRRPQRRPRFRAAGRVVPPRPVPDVSETHGRAARAGGATAPVPAPRAPGGTGRIEVSGSAAERRSTAAVHLSMEQRAVAGNGAQRQTAARRRAESTLRTVLDVVEGRRPLAQLTPFATPRVLRYVAAAAEADPRLRRPPSPDRDRHVRTRSGSALRSLHVSLPARHAAEVTALCRVRGRLRALAARLELTAECEWRCTDLRIL